MAQHHVITNESRYTISELADPESTVRFEDVALNHVCNLHFDRCASAPKFENLPPKIGELEFYNCSLECVHGVSRSIGSVRVGSIVVRSRMGAINPAWIENGYVVSELPSVCHLVIMNLEVGTISDAIVMPSSLRQLYVSSIQTLSAVPDMRQCTNLHLLTICRAGGLRSIDGARLPEISGDKRIDITVENCPDLERIVGTSSKRTHVMSVTMCPKLHRIDFPIEIVRLVLDNVGIERLPVEFGRGEFFVVRNMPNLLNMVLKWPEGTEWVQYENCPKLSLEGTERENMVLPRSMRRFGVYNCPLITAQDFYDRIRIQVNTTEMMYNSRYSNGTEKWILVLKDVPFFDGLGGSATGPWVRIIKFLIR